MKVLVVLVAIVAVGMAAPDGVRVVDSPRSGGYERPNIDPGFAPPGWYQTQGFEQPDISPAYVQAGPPGYQQPGYGFQTPDISPAYVQGYEQPGIAPAYVQPPVYQQPDIRPAYVQPPPHKDYGNPYARGGK